MNIEQLRELLKRAKRAVEAGTMIKVINELSASLERVSSNPSDPSLAEQYLEALGRVRSAATLPERNVFSSREIQQMRGMGIAEAAGSELSAALEAIITNPSLLPQNKAMELAKLSGKLSNITQRAKKLEELNTELRLDETFGVHTVGEDYNAEFSWFVPRGVVEDSLNELKSEIRDLESLISSATELAGKPSYKILYLSASSFGIDVATYKEVVDMIVGGLAWFADQYELFGRYRKMFSEVGSIFHKQATAKLIEEELADDDETRLLDLARSAAERMIGDRPASPEMVSKFSRSLNVVARKFPNGFEMDVKYLEEKVMTDADGAPVPSTDPAASRARLASKIERIEGVLRELPQLPKPVKEPDADKGD
jgi:hypothetical protein